MRIKPYITILWTLVLNLAMLILRVVRKVVLPTRKRKGNLLSSLFILFTGLTEQLIGFGEAVGRLSRMANRSFAGQKYIRKGMLVATWALFILSSFEWTSPQQPALPPAATQQTTILPAQAVSRPAIIATGIPAQAVITTLQSPYIQLSCSSSPSLASRRWLRLCNLRI